MKPPVLRIPIFKSQETMQLSEPQKVELAKLQRSFVINRNRGIHAQQTKCRVQLFIAENNLPYSVDFLLGIEAHNPSPKVDQIRTIETPSFLPVKVEEVKSDEICCKHCNSPIISTTVMRPKGLKPNEKFCSYSCKNNFYKKP